MLCESGRILDLLAVSLEALTSTSRAIHIDHRLRVERLLGLVSSFWQQHLEAQGAFERCAASFITLKLSDGLPSSYMVNAIKINRTLLKLLF